MGLDIWYSEDIARTVASLRQAGARYSGQYQQGYLDALGDIATAFGLQGSPQVRIPGDEARLLSAPEWRYYKEGDNDTQMDAL